MIARWPQADEARFDDEAEADMALMVDLIRQVRNARAEFDVTPGKRVPAIIAAGGDPRQTGVGKLGMLEAQRSLLAFLAKLDDGQLTLTRRLEEKPRRAVALVAAGGVEAYLPLAGLVELEQEMGRLRKALTEAEAEIRRAEEMLANEKFTTKAPPHVVQQQRDRLAGQQERHARLQARLQALSE
jgi:valyl-tRNA synthetase